MTYIPNVDPVPTGMINQTEAEIRSGFKVIELVNFRGKEKCDIYIYQPSSEDNKKILHFQSRAYSKYMSDKGLMFRSQVMQNLEERGLWTKEHDKQIEEKREMISALTIEAQEIQSKPTIKPAGLARLKKIKEFWQNRYNELTTLTLERESYCSHTIESKTEGDSLTYKLSLCVKFADGTLVWPSVEDVDNPQESYYATLIANHAVSFWAGLSQEIISNLPAQLADALFGGEEKSEN